MTHTSTLGAMRLLQSADVFRARLSSEFSAVHGLSVNEFMVMMHLDQAPNSRLSRAELAKRIHVSASTVTRMLAPMEKIGLVAREPDPRDARFAFMKLTSTGETRLSEAKATFDKQAGYLFQDRWENDEVATLTDLLRRFVAGRAGDLSAQ